eukprot:284335-Alexandrium_andersonii.AAC.1
MAIPSSSQQAGAQSTGNVKPLCALETTQHTLSRQCVPTPAGNPILVRLRVLAMAIAREGVHAHMRVH